MEMGMKRIANECFFGIKNLSSMKKILLALAFIGCMFAAHAQEKPSTGDLYDGLTPVSYTHLDVYKRQGEDGVYFTYTEEHPISFNPFYTDDYYFDVEKKDSIKTLLLTLCLLYTSGTWWTDVKRQNYIRFTRR